MMNKIKTTNQKKLNKVKTKPILLNQGWELTPRVDESGELILSVSNQQGKVFIGGDEDWEQEEYIESYKVSINPKKTK